MGPHGVVAGKRRLASARQMGPRCLVEAADQLAVMKLSTVEDAAVEQKVAAAEEGQSYGLTMKMQRRGRDVPPVRRGNVPTQGHA